MDVPREPASTSASIVPVPRAAPSLTTVIEQSARVAVGVASFSLATAIAALERSLGRERAPISAPGANESPTGAALLAGAGLGLATEAARGGVRIARAMGEVASVFVRAASSEAVVRGLDPVDRRLVELNRVWAGERPRTEQAAEAFAGALLPEIVSAVLAQLDLTDLIVERVDLNRIVEGVDVDEIVARVDVDEIVARVDLDRVVDRIDVNELASRIDVEALVARLDLTALAQEVIDELDLATLVRESSGAMAAETVDGLRLQGISADRLVSRVADRILGRDAPSEPGSAPPPEGEER